MLRAYINTYNTAAIREDFAASSNPANIHDFEGHFSESKNEHDFSRQIQERGVE